MGVKPVERIVTDNIVKDMKQYFIIKMPKAPNDIEDIQQLEREYQVIMAAGEHINLIRKEEYHSRTYLTYLALDYAIAKSLYHYLTKTGEIDGAVNSITRNNERWTRYLFRQFIAGLKKIHEASIAHLDIKIDNVLVDIVDVDGMWEPRIKIADFGMSQIEIDLHKVTAKHGLVYRAPEILDGAIPYDGEKADVFASAFILLAIFAIDNFSSNGREQVRSDAYQYFLENGHLRAYWKAKRLTPSQELQDLFAGMLQENPRERWTVD